MRRTWHAIGIGIVAALMLGEVAFRALTPVLPPPSSWPTAEMELKSSQLTSLEEQPQVVVVGSSTSQAAIDPELLSEITGLRAPYNAALPFSSPATNLIWLEDVVLANTSPDLVIIGLPPWAIQAASDVLLEEMSEAANSQDSGLQESLALVENRGVLADWDSLRSRDLLLNTDLWTEAGHFTGYYHRAPITSGRTSPPNRARSLNPIEAQALEEIVELVQRSGATPVFLVEPACCYEAEQSASAAYLEWLDSRAEAFGVLMWDTFSPGWPMEMFADPSHLNRQGTDAYTRHLGKLIVEHIPDASILAAERAKRP